MSRLTWNFQLNMPQKRRGDPDANTHLARIAAQGTLPTGAAEIINADYVTGKANGWYSYIYDEGYFSWNSANMNRVRGRSASLITFNGTCTHAGRKTTFTSSSGYADLGFAPNVLAAASSGGLGHSLLNAPTNVNALTMGCNQSGAGDGSFGIVPYGFGLALFDAGDVTNSRTSAALGATPGAGLFVGNRRNTSIMQFSKYSGSKTVLASRANASAGTQSNRNILVNAYNNAGTPDIRAEASEVDYWVVHSGMPDAIFDLFLADKWATLVALRAL